MNPQVFGDMLRSRMIEGANKRQGLMQQTADAGRVARMDQILGRGMDERAQMAAEGLRAEARGNQASPMPISYEMYGQGPHGSLEARRAISGEDAELNALMNAMQSGQKTALAGALADRQMPGMREGAARMGASVMGAMADEGTRGDIARVGAVSTGVAGLTASGAALIDLMQFLTQGQEVDQERSQVLPS
jgi:hypothetical protein